jgi:hypothetical protein
MPIRKHEFYEGAAIYRLIRAGAITEVKWAAPFFELDGVFAVLLKYTTRGRSPWTFTLTPNEKAVLAERALQTPVLVGLVCGSDGIVSLSYSQLLSIAPHFVGTSHIACYRGHGHHYEIRGPAGVLTEKISPSAWDRLTGTPL